MTMKKDSNGYIFLYATVLVAVVAVLLAFAATYLKPAQTANAVATKQEMILNTVGLTEGLAESSDRKAFLQKQFDKYIVEQLAVNAQGQVLPDVVAFGQDLRAELRKPSDQAAYPLFVARLDNGDKKYIFPLAGKGLWGDLWGYIALDSDLVTVYGTSFDHAGETPGLGAEITTPHFTSQFAGKKMFKDGKFSSIAVVKAGKPLDAWTVDGISGGTMTSQGVQAMLDSSLCVYLPYILLVQQGGLSHE